VDPISLELMVRVERFFRAPKISLTVFTHTKGEHLGAGNLMAGHP